MKKILIAAICLLVLGMACMGYRRDQANELPHLLPSPPQTHLPKRGQ